MTPTAVFLHGFLGTANDWLPVIAECGRGESFCRLTLPGHSPDLSAQDPGRWIDDRMQDLGAAHLDLVGYSMGGRLALQWALRHPARIRSLALISVDPGIDDPAERSQRCKVDDDRAARILGGRYDEFLAYWYGQPIFTGLALNTALFKKVLATRAPPSSGLADMVSLMSPGRQPSLWPNLSGLAMPVLWIAGERDAKYVGIVQRAAGLCRCGAARIVPAASHAVHMEEPTAVARLIQEWWRNDE